jgi:hypothetical protein
MGCLKDWRGVPIADLACDDKGQPDRDKEEGEELAASKSQDQRRIRLAKTLRHDPKDRVTEENRPVRTPSG